MKPEHESQLLLLMGPTGVGKTTLMHGLEKLDKRFVYIRPYTTRPLREHESDKISVSDAVFDMLAKEGKLLLVNELYGTRYAPPRVAMDNAFRARCFPMLDWPVDRLSALESALPQKLFRVYVKPPDFETLANRLRGRPDATTRTNAARRELAALERGDFAGLIDLDVINSDGGSDATTRFIYEAYLGARRISR